MSGETEQQVSGWTVDTLHSHLLGVINERDRRYEQRFDAQEKAVTKAENATEKRFEGVNEFRAALGDKDRDQMPRKEAETVFDNLRARLSSLETNASTAGGRSSGVADSWGYVVGALGLLIGIAAVVISLAS